MTQPASASAQIRVAALLPNKAHAIELALDPAKTDALAKDLGVLGLRKVRLKGALHPVGDADWRLAATLGATIVQSCVVTLDPVTTRIDEAVERLYTTSPLPEPSGEEAEMPEDVSLEPLPAVIDLEDIVSEALALAVPAFPRAPEAQFGSAVFTEPGVTPMTDADSKPFAGLSGLREALQNGKGSKS